MSAVLWINCVDKMPPDRDVEVIIQNLITGDFYQTPADEVWLEIDYDKRHEWQWICWTHEIWEELNES